MPRPKGSRNKPKITHAEAAVANEAAQTEYREQKKRGRPKKTLSDKPHTTPKSGARSPLSDSSKCNDGHPHGGEPCNKPEGHEGLHDNVVAAPEQSSTPSSENTQPKDLALIDLTTGQIVGPAKVLDLKVIPETKYSHSFISTIATCTAQAYFRKSHAKKQLQYPMEKGSCIHALIEGYLKFHKDPVAELPAAWKYWITDHMDEFSPEHQEKALHGLKDAEQILEEFVAENHGLLPLIRPEDVEVNFDILVDINTSVGTIQRKVTGKIDLVLFDEKRESFGILDWKSGSTVPTKDERKRNCQFAIYAKAANELYGRSARFMEFYVLPGQHLCDKKFSPKSHPRPLNERIPECKGLQYAFRVPVPSPDEIQQMIDLYYGNQLIKWEAGLIGKDGLHDYKGNCMRCMYKEACDEWKKPFPAPVFVR